METEAGTEPEGTDAKAHTYRESGRDGDGLRPKRRRRPR